MNRPHVAAMPHDPHGEMVPRTALIAIAALLALVLIAVAAVRLSGVSVREPDAAAVKSLLLRFEDRPDGGVAVIDAVDGRELEHIHGEAGFLRGALRAMARERRKRGIGPEAAFELVGRADGRLTLIDPATQERIDLESFGPTNAGVFARILAAHPANTTHGVR